MWGLGYLLACFDSRQGPVKPEVLSIQWSGRRSNRRLQRNNSLSPNNPLFSLVSSGGFFFKCFLCLNNSPSPCCVALCLTVIHSLSYPALFLPEAKKKLLDQSHTEGEQNTGGEGRSCRCERNSAVRHTEGAWGGGRLWPHVFLCLVSKPLIWCTGGGLRLHIFGGQWQVSMQYLQSAL